MIDKFVKAAMPFAFVVAVVVPPNVPPPVAIAAVTATPDCRAAAPFESVSCTTGCCGNAVPLVAVADGCVVIATCVAAPVAATVTFATPLVPLIVARIDAEPGATAATMPLSETVATSVADDDQVTDWPEMTAPELLVATACAFVV
ncbi:MAG TPA: hypothetical protein VN650_14315 [Gemmatimonadaceae bacterium]|nr:hypothetical protein [Gemmatimonadaceae bacterium]